MHCGMPPAVSREAPPTASDAHHSDHRAAGGGASAPGAQVEELRGAARGRPATDNHAPRRPFSYAEELGQLAVKV